MLPTKPYLDLGLDLGYESCCLLFFVCCFVCLLIIKEFKTLNSVLPNHLQQRSQTRRIKQMKLTKYKNRDCRLLRLLSVIEITPIPFLSSECLLQLSLYS